MNARLCRGRIWAPPAAFGLLSALVADGVEDGLSWAALAAPAGVCVLGGGGSTTRSGNTGRAADMLPTHAAGHRQDRRILPTGRRLRLTGLPGVVEMFASPTRV